MYRDIDENLIKEECLMTKDDFAPVACSDCAGCSECCTETACMIVLDSVDVKLMKKGLHMSFEELLKCGAVKLSIVDGIVLPGLGTNEKGACNLLDKNGRCSIHKFRPGICRMFPLARIYHDDGSFSYFLQKGECDRRTGEMVKISDWLGYEDMDTYEKEVREYHDRLNDLREKCAYARTQEELSGLQTNFLKENFFFI